MRKLYFILIIGFIVLYSLFIFHVDLSIYTGVASEIIIASVFFFTLFAGYFITRQNARYTTINELLASRDGAFSYLYRVSGLVPRIQKEVREIIRSHYEKILENNNWAYHEFNPSMTITRLTRAFGSLTNEEGGQVKVSTSYEDIWITIQELQKTRKRIIVFYKEKLLLSQWVLIYLLAGILIFSFSLLQSNSLLVDVMKIGFGIAVFLVITLLKQLNDLSIFGKDFSQVVARDVLRIIDEVDVKELGEEKPH